MISTYPRPRPVRPYQLRRSPPWPRVWLSFLAACSSAPPEVAPPPPAPPPVAVAPPVSLSPRVVEQASAYRAYVDRAGAISPGFTGGSAIGPER